MKITVFTPTYNRAYIIHNLYKSLQRQTFKDFEWLIVDDGSTDGTEALVCKWKKENNFFMIRYYKTKNGGKCRAINRALELAEGKLFFTVDSDDYLTNDALEKLNQWEAELPRNGLYCGVAGNLGISPDKATNSHFSGEYFEGTALDRYHNVDGERAMAFYTDVHRKYRYPEFQGEKFMTEAVTWNRMANDGYKMRFYNDIIWIYEYKEDGLTKSGSRLFLDNPRGYGLWLREKADFLHFSLYEKMKMYYTFACDMSFQKNIKMVADCIGAPEFIIAAFRYVHSLKRIFSKK